MSILFLHSSPFQFEESSPQPSKFEGLIQWIRNDHNHYERTCMSGFFVNLSALILTIVSIATLIGIIPLVYAAKEWNRQAVEIRSCLDKDHLIETLKTEGSHLRGIIRQIVSEHNRFLSNVHSLAYAEKARGKRLGTQENLKALFQDEKAQQLPLWYDLDICLKV